MMLIFSASCVHVIKCQSFPDILGTNLTIFSPEDMVSHMNRENTSTRQNLRLSNIDLAAAKKAAELAAKLGGVQLEDNVFKQKQ